MQRACWTSWCLALQHKQHKRKLLRTATRHFRCAKQSQTLCAWKQAVRNKQKQRAYGKTMLRDVALQRRRAVLHAWRDLGSLTHLKRAVCTAVLLQSVHVCITIWHTRVCLRRDSRLALDHRKAILMQQSWQAWHTAYRQGLAQFHNACHARACRYRLLLQRAWHAWLGYRSDQMRQCSLHQLAGMAWRLTVMQRAFRSWLVCQQRTAAMLRSGIQHRHCNLLCTSFAIWQLQVRAPLCSVHLNEYVTIMKWVGDGGIVACTCHDPVPSDLLRVKFGGQSHMTTSQPCP
jgi:hypothetical protein